MFFKPARLRASATDIFVAAARSVGVAPPDA